MDLLKTINRYIYVARWELVSILRDGGVMLIMLGAIFIYSTLYWLVYHNQVVREVPIAVIDMDETESSRGFIRDLDASPNVSVAFEPEDMDQARSLFYDRKIYGVIVVPDKFEKDISSGVQTIVSIYADASYFLMYKQLYAAATSTIVDKNIKIETSRFMAKGIDGKTAVALADPVEASVTKLYNRYEGYATFVMPAIMVLILQQTMLIGIGMVNGTMTEKGQWRRYKKRGRSLSALLVVMGKSLAYIFFAMALALVVYGVYYKVLGYPSLGNELEVLLFFMPYLLSVVFMGIALSTLFKYRETSVITLAAWSVPFLLLSGISFPMEGMPSWLYALGQILPASSAINGYVRLNVMGVELSDVFSEYVWLWILTLVYFVFAVLMVRVKLNSMKDVEKMSAETIDDNTVVVAPEPVIPHEVSAEVSDKEQNGIYGKKGEELIVYNPEEADMFIGNREKDNFYQN